MAKVERIAAELKSFEREWIAGRIAAELDSFEREWITGWQGPKGAAFNAVATGLMRKGLLRGPLDWTLNETGLAVRDHLERQANEID